MKKIVKPDLDCKRKNHRFSTKPQRCVGNEKKKEFEVRLAGKSTLFTRFDSILLSSIPKSEYFLVGIRFGSIVNGKAAVNEYFTDLSDLHFRDRINLLVNH